MTEARSPAAEYLRFLAWVVGVAALIALNNAFHDLFALCSGNTRLRSLLADLRTQLTRLERWFYSYAAHTDHSISQHADIIAAIEANAPDQALALLEKNMALTYEKLREER